MNERIIELALLAGAVFIPTRQSGRVVLSEDWDHSKLDIERYTQLIAQECIAMCDEAREKYFDAQVRTDNFSEKNIHASGGVACKNIREQIVEHFGV